MEESGQKSEELFQFFFACYILFRSAGSISHLLQRYTLRNFYSEVSREFNLMFNTCSEETHANNKLISSR